MGEDLLDSVNLRYSSDSRQGFSRKVRGKKFLYFDTNGKRITDNSTIDRINKLAIPPAYTNVWICPSANGHLQATGYDSKKRKQYRYHPLWIKLSQEEKFSRIMEFARHLPKIRKQFKKDLIIPGMPRNKILATVVWLLENTLIRIGNEEYEKENKSYGLTTLKNKHVSISSENKIVLQFKGKSGIYHKVTFKNKKVAKIIRRCKDIPGQDLFEYFDEEKMVQTVSSNDVNDYLKQISGAEITAKDFRTWGGTILAAVDFDRKGVSKEEDELKQNILETIKKVASHLRNKPNTCRKYYIHPSVITAYSKGYILSTLKNIENKVPHRRIKGLDDQENDVLSLLKHMGKYQR